MPEIKADLPKLCLDIMCNSSFCFGTMIWIPFPVGLLFGFSFLMKISKVVLQNWKIDSITFLYEFSVDLYFVFINQQRDNEYRVLYNLRAGNLFEKERV